ncbi:MAG: prephenate dehydrogenase/arogenate dehydrogenase family protein [Candidatus Helarchaeota archaeon]
MAKSMENFFKNIKIAIIGGTGGMGRVFAKNLKEKSRVIICSRKLKKAETIVKELGGDLEAGLISDCREADIVIVSVPTDKMLENCRKAIKIMKAGSLLIDQSSVKTGLVDKLTIPKNIEYISAHCLFGPQGNFLGENVILIPVKGEKWLPKIKGLFEILGSKVFIKSLKEHDILMSKIQSLFHFTILCMVVAMAKSDIDSKFYTRSFKMMIPNFKNLQNNLNVIFEIQKSNPYSKEMRKYFTKIVNELEKLEFNEFKDLIEHSFKKLKF